MGEYTIPGGNSKGKTLSEASDGDLTYWAKRIEESIAGGTSRNATRDTALAAAMRAELDFRRKTGVAPERSAAQPSHGAGPSVNALAIREQVDHLTGSYTEPSELSKQLKAASEVANLVTPQTTAGRLPEGCVVALSAVLVDKVQETYGVGGGKVALDRTALSKISAAAGVSWDPLLSCRLDNGTHPHYCHFRAVGYVRDFDGTQRTIKGEVELDLREGSTVAEAMKPEELAGHRKFILRSAETKAMNRAVRGGLSVRSSYQPQDLEKPFVVARLMFTGQTQDPELKTMFAAKMADSFLGARGALYGAEAPPARQLVTGHEPPPIDESRYDDYDDDVPDGEEVKDGQAADGSPWDLEG